VTFAVMPTPSNGEASSASRAWECAAELLNNYADRLTIAQLIACHIALLAGPILAPLGSIALAAQIIGCRR
jgi:hypothetical protein